MLRGADHHERGSGRIEAADVRLLQTEEAIEFHADGREDVNGWHALGDERRDVAERGLLVGEPLERLTRFRVRNRGCDELREASEAYFGVRREWFTRRDG